MRSGTLEETLTRISEQVDHIQIQLDDLQKNNEIGQKEYLNMREFVAYAGIPLSTGYQISCKNLIPKYRFGKRVLFKRKDVIEFIEQHRIASKSEIHTRAINNIMMGDHNEEE